MNTYRGTCSECDAKVIVRGDDTRAIVSTGGVSWISLPDVVAWECPACDTYN